MFYELKDSTKDFLTCIRIYGTGFLLSTTGYEDETYFYFRDICSFIFSKGNLYILLKPKGKKIMLLNKKYIEELFISQASRDLRNHWLDYNIK